MSLIRLYPSLSLKKVAIKKAVLKLSEHLIQIIVISVIGISAGFFYELSFFRVLIAPAFAALSWIMTWEGILLISEGKKAKGVSIGSLGQGSIVWGVASLESGKNIAIERQPISLMPGEALLLECEAFKKKALGYAFGKLSLTNYRVVFVPRDPIFSRKSRMVLLHEQIDRTSFKAGTIDRSMSQLVYNGNLFLVDPKIKMPDLMGHKSFGSVSK